MVHNSRDAFVNHTWSSEDTKAFGSGSVLKGTGFSPYIKSSKTSAGFSP
jgi:hypothetical protein